MSSPHALELPKIFEEAQDFLPLNVNRPQRPNCIAEMQAERAVLPAGLGIPACRHHKHLETGSKDRVSYVLRQDKITLVLTSPLEEGGPINDHINRHGDGVKAVALWVDDAAHSWKETTSRGAKSYLEPTRSEDATGSVVCSGIHTCSDTVHLFVERSAYQGVFLPVCPLDSRIPPRNLSTHTSITWSGMLAGTRWTFGQNSIRR